VRLPPRLECLWRGHRWGPLTIAEAGYSFQRALLRECRRCGLIDHSVVEGKFKPSRPAPSAVVEQLLDDVDES